MRVGVALDRSESGSAAGPVVLAAGPGETIAAILDGNPLAAGWPETELLVDSTIRSDTLIAWSGTLADELFARHPLTWMAPGREALDRFCATVAPGLDAAGRTLCFHPHARHVLSDPTSCVAFLRDHEADPLAVALAPSSMLEPGMLPDLDDHLERAFEILGPACHLLILHDVKADDGGGSCVTVPLGEGVLPRDRVLALIERFVPAAADLVLHPGPVEPQLEWLGRSKSTFR